MSPVFKFLALLTISNTFMTIAWYGHLKDKTKPILITILMSWLIALPEYIFQVPANRIGSEKLNLTQLKVSQECLTLVVFMLYAYFVFKEPIRWNNAVSMLLIVGAVYFAFRGER
jgi:uncharacterized protein (DUF486 family)